MSTGIRGILITRAVCALLALALVLTSCTSMRRAPVTAAASQQELYWHVDPGDRVRVIMRDGRRARFRVRTADAAAIVSRDGTRYEHDDILTVERQELSEIKTAVFVGVLVAFFSLVRGAP